MSNTKIFVIDTNVLIHDPDAIFRFQEHDLVVPIFVIEEVDNFKKEGSERGRNSRHLCRLLDELRTSTGKRLSDGVPLGDKLGSLRIVVPDFHSEDTREAPDNASQDRAILKTAMKIRHDNPDRKVVFVTMDVNLRIRAAAQSMDVEDYKSPRTKQDLAASVGELLVPGEDIDSFFEAGEIDKGQLEPNACLLLRNEANPAHTAIGRVNPDGTLIRSLKVPREGIYNVRPRNKEQAFALDLLLDDDVKLVTLIGKAGTGKTLLAIAAGIHQVTSGNVFSRVLVSRPIMPLGRDIGHLPGDLSEKLNPWMQPIFDNLDFIFNRKGNAPAYTEFLENGTLQVEPLTYIRGRSLPYQYLIVDEAQNLTPHEIKTIITRAGDGAKIVLTGDPEQIDNPYVDAASNGLSVVADRFRNSSIAGNVVLTRGERSALAEEAANLL